MVLVKQPLLSERDSVLLRRWAFSLSEQLRASVQVWCWEDGQWQLHSSDSCCDINDRWNLKQTIVPPDDLLQQGEDTGQVEFRAEFIANNEYPTYWGLVPEFRFPVRISFHSDEEVNPRHLSVIAALTLAQVRAAEELHASQVQNRAFIQQVTQDFEELTWLRGVSQQVGDADIRCPVHKIASQQLPQLRRVIQAEYVAFFDPSVPPKSQLSTIQLSHFPLASAGDSPIEVDRVHTFVRFVAGLSKSRTAVFNVQSAGGVFDHYPEVRNCIIVRVEKQGKLYGYLVALNKQMDFLGSSPGAFLNMDPNGFQFGTFEAALLDSLGTVLASHATNSDLFREQEELLKGVIRAIINAIDAKDAYTCGHSDRVASFASAIAMQMGMGPAESERIYMAGLLHDVGKIGIPDSILSKPGKLTDEEFAIVKKHPEIGFQILKHLAPLDYVLPGVLHHHEAVNGSGYPHGLTGESIPLQGRILAVADAYDAMTSDRPYRKGMPSEKAEAILRKESGSTWDDLVVQSMLHCIELGTVVPQSEQLRSTSIESTPAPLPAATSSQP